MKTAFRPFRRAVPVWSSALAGQMNCWLSFHTRVQLAPGARGGLRLAAAQAYRIWANGRFAGRGPARTAHGYARVDEWPVQADETGRLELIIEVMGYGVPTFCSTHEPAFLCAELVAGNEVVAWTAAHVAAYVQAHDVPTNPLHAQGYPSIGCEPCTTAVRPGEDPRAGRWRNSTKTECGLHLRPNVSPHTES